MAKSRHTRPQNEKSSGRPVASRRPQAGGGRAQTPELAPDWPIVALAGLGMLITLYLTSVVLWGERPAFCEPGAGCDVILQSQFSTVFGIPLALWGFAIYTLIALMAWRMRPGLRRWRRLWTVSLVGFAISVYLTVLGIVSMQAVCIWCLTSLTLMTAIFILVAVRRPDSAPGVPWRSWGINTGAIVLVSLVVLHLQYYGFPRQEDPRLQALAIHLEETGALFYGASWCPVCQEQKRMFRASADRLPYIECYPQGRGGLVARACLDAGIVGYPTWIIGGQRINNLLAPQDLALFSGFDWDGFTPP